MIFMLAVLTAICDVGGKELLVGSMRVGMVKISDGMSINGKLFNSELPLERYHEVFGLPSRTIEAGSPAPFGHRNNQVHVFDSQGIYLTEHHASRLIESVNFVFDPLDSPFPIDRAFDGILEVGEQTIRAGMLEADIESEHLSHDIPGEYSVKLEKCWIGISAQGRRDARGKRRKPRYVVRVSVCF